jgi:NADH-quinone oxidoreductase subunit J
VVVYIGAIAILIIFAIMLTPQVTRMGGARNNQWIGALVAAAVLFAVLGSVLTPAMHKIGVDDWNASFIAEDQVQPVPADGLTDFGKSLVDRNRYLLPFEVASVLLMAALIGAALLVNEPPTRKKKHDERIQEG